MLYEWNEDREEGFSLVELLVVIVIIGILSAIVIGAFLNQRKKANDAAVESDMRTVSIAIESALVDQPNATSVTGKSTGVKQILAAGINTTLAASDTGNEIILNVDEKKLEPVNLSEGVDIVVNVKTGETASNEYEIKGWHENGKAYTEESPLTYNSALGGFTDDTTPVASGGSEDGEIVPGDGDEPEGSGTGILSDLEKYTIEVGKAAKPYADEYGYEWASKGPYFYNSETNANTIKADILGQVEESYEYPELVRTAERPGAIFEYAIDSQDEGGNEYCAIGQIEEEGYVGMSVDNLEQHFTHGWFVHYDSRSGGLVRHSDFTAEELKNDPNLGGECNRTLINHREMIEAIVEEFGGARELAEAMYEELN